jgi:hypothetical protein
LYEIVLQEGTPADILAYVDGALLVDLWEDLVLPRAVRSDRPGRERDTRTSRLHHVGRAAVVLVLVIGEGVELGEVVDVLGAVFVPEIMEAALLAR